MIRILFVSHSFPLPGQPLSNVGGMQRLAVETQEALAAHPDVYLSSLVLETAWEDTALRMVSFMARLLREIPRRVREERIDVVLFSSMVTASLVLPLRRRITAAGAVTAAVPVGRDVTLPNPAYQRLVPRIFRALDLVLPISRATGEECLVRGLKRERMHIVPCGIDLSRFPPVEDRKVTRADLLRSLESSGAPVPEDALLLCSVGRHQERKGFQWFVQQVMPHLPPDVIYLLGGDGPMTEHIRSTVERLGLEDQVRILGRVSEEMLGAMYRGADLFVMPNVPVPGDIEGFGVVMLEAGLGGLPTLAADLEGIQDVIHEGKNGHLLPTQNARAFAEAILRYRNDPALRTAASRAAREQTASNFAWPVVADRYVSVFRATLPGHRSRSDARPVLHGAGRES